ncbi:MAG TPA: methyltransferase domain-containing protein [Burkholderiaceae bacterium]|nr:methyltransferase domain-containing protein [Burkholderiaceae bacterium]
MSAVHVESAPVARPADPDKLNAFLGKMVGDMGAVASGALVLLGDRLGLYRAMRGGEPMTPDELAGRTGTHERYVREWLSAQAAAGYVDYDDAAGTFCLNPEQAAVFADDDSPASMAGAFEVLSSLWLDEPKVAEAFRHGRGLGWHEHSQCLFRGTERFFRPGYNANLLPSWLPALDGVVDKLTRGATVADVGCGHGASTIVMARAFPNSQFVGFDYHAPSVEAATKAARNAGLTNVRFEVAHAKSFPGRFDLVAFFDCLHDMGDPVGAATHVREALAPDGTWMIVEPYANDRLRDNLNPVGRVYYAASTMICTPCSLSQEVGLGLGAQAGEARLRQVVTDGGFSRCRRAAETPFNIVLDVRP